jgi:hypothetical protein
LLLPEWASINIAPFIRNFPPIIFFISADPADWPAEDR